MSSKRWLKAEIRKWVRNDLITSSEGEAILAQYGEESHSYKGVFFMMASLSIGGGLLSLGASFWNGLTQGQRFVTAMVPILLSALLMLILVALDRKVPVTGHWKNVVRRHLETAYMDESEREEESVTRYRVPDYAREIICAFHGAALLLGAWLLHDTFFIPGTLPVLLTGCGVILLLLTFLMDSLSFSIFSVLVATGASLAGSYDWIYSASWGFMAAIIPFLLMLLKNDRQYSLIVLSWCWTAGVLLLISRTTNMLWEMMFFSEAAAFTWIIGSMMRSYTAAGMAVRFLGSTAMFGVLGVSSFGRLWAAPLGQESGGLLWGAFGLLLVLNLYVLMKALQKREWLAAASGMAPISMLGAAFLSLWDTSGAASGLVITLTAVLLSLGVILRGIQTGRSWQGMLGFILLFAMSALRMLDSTLTLAQRGIYFLAAGLVMGFVCLAVYWPRRKNRRKGLKRPAKHKGAFAENQLAVQHRSREIPKTGKQENWPVPPVPVFRRPDDKGGNTNEQTK